MSATASLFERTIHHIRIDQAERSMVERGRHGADDFKSKLLPEHDRGLVGGDHEVELHRAESEPPGLGQTMLAHQPPDAASLRRGRYHERRVRDMRSAS